MPSPSFQTTWVKTRARNTMAIAKHKAGRLTPLELARMKASLQPDFNALCAGRATLKQFAGVSTACELALAIEKKGVVRGLKQPLVAAEQTLLTLKTWAEETHDWVAPTPTPAQTEILTELLRLHLWQLQHLSYGEYQAAWQLMIGTITSQGGQVIDGQPLTAER